MFDKIFDKFSKTKKFISKELLYSFYNIVSQEIQQGIKDEGVWAKSFADAQGDEQKTKAIYIELMVERLILKHEAELVEYGQELLKKNNSVKLIGNPKNKGGVLSFTLEGVHPHDIATILDEDGVAIRAGHHCCQVLHDKLNIPASARASVGIYNTKEDLDKLNDAINNCKKIFNLK